MSLREEGPEVMCRRLKNAEALPAYPLFKIDRSKHEIREACTVCRCEVSAPVTLPACARRS